MPTSVTPDLLNLMRDGLLVVNKTGKVIYANPAAATLLNRSIEQLAGHSFGFPLQPNDPVELDIPTGPTPRIVEMITDPITWHGEPADLVALRDVTLRKTIETELRAANDLNTAILDSLSASVAVLDAHGVIIRTNYFWRQFAEENGDPAHATTDIGINYFDVCRAATDDYGPAALAGMYQVLNGDIPFFELEYPCPSPSEERWFLMRARPLVSAEFTGLVVAHINVTDHRKSVLAFADNAQQRTEATRQQLEQAHMELLSFPTPLTDHTPRIVEARRDQWLSAYAQLTLAFLEARIYKHDDAPRRATIEAFASELAQARATPRDLIDIHLDTLRRLSRQPGPHARKQALLSGSQQLLLEIMGHLAFRYRQLALQPRPAPPAE